MARMHWANGYCPHARSINQTQTVRNVDCRACLKRIARYDADKRALSDLGVPNDYLSAELAGATVERQLAAVPTAEVER
jgi:hypothetical protein